MHSQTHVLRIVIRVIKPTASAIPHAASATVDTMEQRARHTSALRTVTAPTRQTASRIRHVLCATLDTMEPLASHVRVELNAFVLLICDADTCIANCDTSDQANCISDSACSQCNVGYFGATCQAHTCISHCDNVDQANGISDTTCAVCNTGYFGPTCQPCLCAKTFDRLSH
jgi:hypothetical protein